MRKEEKAHKQYLAFMSGVFIVGVIAGIITNRSMMEGLMVASVGAGFYYLIKSNENKTN